MPISGSDFAANCVLSPGINGFQVLPPRWALTGTAQAASSVASAIAAVERVISHLLHFW